MNDTLHHHSAGPPTAPALLLGPSLGTSTALWDAVAPELSSAFRTVRWDLPGHGRSPAGLIGPDATVAQLGALVLELADHLGIDRFHYAGVSLGGAVGLWLAVHHPERVDRLAVVCSSAHFGPPEPWHERAALVRESGTGAVAGGAPGRWFTPGFLEGREGQLGHTLVDDLRRTDPQAYAACCDALAVLDLRPDLPSVTAPTLVLAGRDDPATPPAHAREIADAVPGARLTELAHASHLAPAEQPGAVLAALRDHFAAPGPGRGMAVRREVLGDAHVDRAQARTTPLTAGFQDFIARYAWGEIWTDPTLSRRDRSLVTLTALVAHGHLDELGMHVRAAVRNGLRPEEIGAVLLQCGVYVGVPAANAALAVAQGVLAEDGLDGLHGLDGLDGRDGLGGLDGPRGGDASA
ncbi:3-oxoadipate enol-lactonase [Streptomyces sp. LHD-70]|uniref:bifunctional 3-oxoadipate enol-lactonase/4-carboxymuconolactone decarboxylase PcaDC n=1 Tax=Streptomyces sp. LHD-70 TaxID=3072140 RepID=UPI00280D4483|nr:3-oxoadipate enol-lactonase [Streptomyces sp. LHD-70]MDQ8703919.1 3-oxoadipate enol-lactonase [Streptomyces sp. LHD-70]